MVIDLTAEWNVALAAMTEEAELDLIYEHGVPAELFRRCRADLSRQYHRLIGQARVHVEGASYTTHPDGAWAFITPLRRERRDTIGCLTPAAFVRWGELIDLVAWHPATPSSWALRAGDPDATWLGLVDWPNFYNGPVRVWRGPLGWLRASAQGLVPLIDADLHILEVMRPGVIAEDFAHREELRRRAGIGPFEHSWSEEIFHERTGRQFYGWGGYDVGI